MKAEKMVKMYTVQVPNGNKSKAQEHFFSIDYPQHKILELLGEEAVYRGMIKKQDYVVEDV